MLYAFSLSPKSFLSLTTLTLLFTPFCVSSVVVCVFRFVCGVYNLAVK